MSDHQQSVEQEAQQLERDAADKHGSVMVIRIADAERLISEARVGRAYLTYDAACGVEGEVAMHPDSHHSFQEYLDASDAVTIAYLGVADAMQAHRTRYPKQKETNDGE